MTFNQQPKPVLNKLQLLAGVAVVSIVGGISISVINALASRSPQPEHISEIKQPEIMAQPQAIAQPQATTSQTQIIILTPNNETELDCLRYGGGLGCFDNNYQPDLPQHWASEKEEQPERGEPRNVGDLIYKFW
ncbi:MAG: hypothetical protein ACOVQ7_27700 [Limnoraphis robusta]